jgi:condensin complex subunit 2
MLNKNEESAWQKASASLDASAKIYGFRVDSVHSETFKFLSGLNRTDYKEDNIDLVEGEKKERMKRDGSSTLEKDVHKLDLDKYDLEFDVDPLFKNMTARFNETGARGLLLKTLQLDNNIDILLETNQTIKNTELKGEISEAIRSIIQDIYHDFNDYFADLELCPNLSYFKQHVIDLEDKDEKLFENIHNLDNSMQDDMMVLDDECDHISIKSADINPILDENDTPIKEENIVNEIDIIPDNDIRINLSQIGSGQVISSELLNKFKRSLLNIQKESKDGNKTNKKSKSVKDSTTPLINFNIHNEVKKSDIFKEKRKTNEDKKPSIPKSTMHKKLKILYNYGVEL